MNISPENQVQGPSYRPDKQFCLECYVDDDWEGS